MRIAFILALVGCSFFQQEPATTIRTSYDFFEADHLGNVYTVHGDEVCKFLPNGRLHARYSNLKLGSVTSLDVSNPLKIMLYYRDFQQIVFLDNQLSVNSDQVSLERLGYEQTYLACVSANNSFWVYDKQNNELLRFDETGRKIASTGNLKQVLRTDLTPEFMTEYNGYLFLNSPSSGIYVFDMFGAFSKIIAVKGPGRFQPNENILYYQQDSAMCSYNHRLFEESCKTVKGAGAGSVIRYSQKKLYIGRRDSIQVIPAEL